MKTAANGSSSEAYLCLLSITSNISFISRAFTSVSNRLSQPIGEQKLTMQNENVHPTNSRSSLSQTDRQTDSIMPIATHVVCKKLTIKMETYVQRTQEAPCHTNTAVDSQQTPAGCLETSGVGLTDDDHRHHPMSREHDRLPRGPTAPDWLQPCHSTHPQFQSV